MNGIFAKGWVHADMTIYRRLVPFMSLLSHASLIWWNVTVRNSVRVLFPGLDFAAQISADVCEQQFLIFRERRKLLFWESIPSSHFGNPRERKVEFGKRDDRIVKADARIEGKIQRKLENGELQNNVSTFRQNCYFTQSFSGELYCLKKKKNCQCSVFFGSF